MADLYTSLVRLKQTMNGGQLPPMTPVPEKVHHIIDPAFTIGLGALREDEEKGLQCPVRGCGEWRHGLTKHINADHADVGGAAGIRTALSIPSTARLVSQALRSEMAARSTAAWPERAASMTTTRGRSPSARRVAGRTWAANASTMCVRNLRDRCDAQVKHKLIDLQVQIGRRPSVNDARAMLSKAFVNAVCKAFGTWNNALAQCGMESVQRGGQKFAKERVLESLAAYYAENRCLPSSYQAKAPTRAPAIPTTATIMRALGGKTWRDSMRTACLALNIRDGRYGVKPIADYYADDAKEAKNPKEAHDVAAD